MGYNVNMNPMLQSGINQANMLQGLGQTIGGAIGGYQRRGEQEAKQAQMQQLMQSAASGDPQAIEMLYSIDPQAGKAMEQRLFTGQDRATKQEGLLQDQRSLDTANLIEKMSLMSPSKQKAVFDAAVLDDKFDIDASDEPFFMDPNAQRAAVAKVKGNDYANNFFGKAKETEFQQGTGKMSGYAFNPETGGFTIDPAIKARIEDIKAKPTLDAKDRQAINKDFTALTKDTKLIRNTAKDLDKLSKMVGKDGNVSGPSSIAMVFKFMKALDPTSVVRESEFATAENSSGVPENVRNMYNKLVQGGKLGQEQVKQFVRTAKLLANSSIDSSATEVNSFLDTFEGEIPASFKGLMIKRLPTRFDIEGVYDASAAGTVNNETATDEFAGFKVVR